MKTILVTGASGLLGSHIVKFLVIEKKYDIIILVRTQKQAEIWQHFGIKTIVGDLETCNFSLLRGISTIIHTAAIAGDWIDKKKAFKVNVEATSYLLDQMIKQNSSTFIYISTIGVYGHKKYTEATEDKAYQKWAYYEYTKIEAEKIILQYRKNYPEKRFHIIRPPSMYGEGDRHILPRFIHYLEKGKFIFISGGSNLFPILHASDGAKAIISLLESNFEENKTYHMCDDSKATLKDFITILRNSLGINDTIRSVPYPLAYTLSIVLEIYGKIRHTEPFIFRKRVKYLGLTRHVSIERIKKDLNFKPDFQLQIGIPSVLNSIEEEKSYLNTSKSILYYNTMPYHLFKVLSGIKN